MYTVQDKDILILVDTQPQLTINSFAIELFANDGVMLTFLLQLPTPMQKKGSKVIWITNELINFICPCWYWLDMKQCDMFHRSNGHTKLAIKHIGSNILSKSWAPKTLPKYLLHGQFPRAMVS